MFQELKMDDDLAATPTVTESNEKQKVTAASADISEVRADFERRLLAASLRTEAVRAGMIDLDGLKLLDLNGIHLGDNDAVLEGHKIMADLRRAKPWLFGSGSTSSTAFAPASQPARQRTAMDMTDEEYAAARTAVTRHRF